MTHYQPGHRVALTHTGKPDTPPWPGEQGVVRAYDSGTQVVHVGWDNGTVTPIHLDAGDRLDILAAPTAIPAAAWDTVLATATSRGSQDGRLAVDRWANDTLTDHAESRTTARQVLAAVKDDDPDAAETLPSSASSAHSQPLTDWQLSDLLADGNPAHWRPVSSERWEQAVWAYRDAFDAGVRDTAVSRCRRILIPAADGRDLDEMQPDRVRLGGVGVFSGEWMWTDGGNGPDYARAGFVGTLIDIWNGWAVFSCTRQVAEAIVADLQDQRGQRRQQLQATGVPEQDLEHQVDATFAVLSFDGDTLVADQRILCDDPDAIEYITPDADGRYVVMGRNWCWDVVDPYRCDRITGELPAPGDQQQFVVLTHTADLRLPHGRLHLQLRKQWPAADATAYVAALTMQGQRIGTVGYDGAGSDIDLLLTDAAFGPEQLAHYLSACRWRGRPATLQQLLTALADEALLTDAIAQATAAGGTLLRRVDADGSTRTARPIRPIPHGWTALTTLGTELTHEDGDGRWQIWATRGWLTLPTNATTIT